MRRKKMCEHKNISYDTEMCDDCGFTFEAIEMKEGKAVVEKLNARIFEAMSKVL